MDKNIKKQLNASKIEILKNEVDLLSLVTNFEAPGYVLVPVENTDVQKVLDYSAFEEGAIIKAQKDFIKPIKNFAKGGYYKIAIDDLPREQGQEIYRERMSGVAENIAKNVKEAKNINNTLIFYIFDETRKEIDKRGLLNYKGLKLEDNYYSIDRYRNELEKVVVDQLAENDEFINAWFDREEVKNKYLAPSVDYLYDDRCKALFQNEKLMKKAIEAKERNILLLVGDTEKKDNLDMVLNCLLVNTGDKDKDFETNEKRVQLYAGYFASEGCIYLLTKSTYFDKRFFEVVATYAPTTFYYLLRDTITRTTSAVYNAAFDFARSDFGLKNKTFFEGGFTSIRFDYEKVAPMHDEEELYETYKKSPYLMDNIPPKIIAEWKRRISEEKTRAIEDENSSN